MPEFNNCIYTYVLFIRIYAQIAHNKHTRLSVIINKLYYLITLRIIILYV